MWLTIYNENLWIHYFVYHIPNCNATYYDPNNSNSYGKNQKILGGKISNLQNSKTLNFFPNQATETVRLEEALLGTLSIINAYTAG